jgi:peptide/nickel transport system ATP-binding protein
MKISPLRVTDLRIELDGGDPIVDEFNLTLNEGEIVGLVGESGSGKTTVSLAFLGHTRPGVRIAQGSIVVSDEELMGRSAGDLRRFRGNLISYVPQDPSASLNPSARIGDQLADVLRAHRRESDVGSRVGSTLERLRLPADREFRRRYPHQLSGGQKQRVAIAMALICEPAVVVMDEPTTGLDVVTEARILAEIRRLRSAVGVSIVYVSHNLAVVSSLADRVGVMYAGRIVELGRTSYILGRPRHPYTAGLVSSVPDHAEPRVLEGIAGVAVGVGGRPMGCSFAPRCPQAVARCLSFEPPLELIDGGTSVRCFEWRRTAPLVVRPREIDVASTDPNALLAVRSLVADYKARRGMVVAVDGVTFSVGRREVMALVGESGSGKTTIGRCIAGLHAPRAGEIYLDGTSLAPAARDRSRDQRRRLQIVFQNPFDSLNPKHRVVDAIARAACLLRGLSGRDARGEALALLEAVQLPPRIAQRYPRELSGGELQRVAIARALAARPEIVVCDEVTSALDVSVQATVMQLLGELRSELGLSLLFISHDLGVVASIADRVVVLSEGSVQEEGAARQILHQPQASYTRTLLDAAPRLQIEGERVGR